MENNTATGQKSLNVNDSEAKCPFHGGALKAKCWRWNTKPRLVAQSVEVEHPRQQSSLSNPMGEDFNYAKEFKSLDLKCR